MKATAKIETLDRLERDLSEAALATVDGLKRELNEAELMLTVGGGIDGGSVTRVLTAQTADGGYENDEPDTD